MEGSAGSIEGVIVMDAAGINGLIGAFAAAGNAGDISDHVQQIKEDIQEAESSGTQDDKYTGGRTQEELDELAKDPDHAGSTRDIDIGKGKREAQVGLDMEEQGLLKDIVREPSGQADFIENGGAGQKWDVKAFNSNYRNGYDLNDAMLKINESINKGENVIVDTINMKPEHISELMNAVTGSGLDEYVIWWLAK